MDTSVQRIEKTIEELTAKVNSIEQKMTGVMIDVQSCIPKKLELQPGTGVKLSYDKDGLVRGSSSLEPSDIPTLPMTKIEGLEECWQNIPTSSELQQVQAELLKKTTKGDVTSTATKVNIDANGHVVGTGKLMQADIPNIPIAKIINLSMVLSDINGKIAVLRNTVKELADAVKQLQSTPQTPIATFSENCESQLQSQINELSQAVFLINQRLNRRDSHYTSPIRVSPGRYSSFTVDRSGSIVDADEMTDVDIETIHAEINEIKATVSQLSQQMQPKANATDVTKLQNTLNQKIADIPDMQKVVTSAQEITTRDDRLKRLDDLVNSLNNRMKSINLGTADGGAYYHFTSEIDSINRSIDYLMTTVRELMDSSDR